MPRSSRLWQRCRRTVEGSLGCVHTLEVLLKVLAREIRSEGHNFLDACIIRQPPVIALCGDENDLRGSLVYSGQTSSSHAYKISSYINVAPGATCLKNETFTGSPILTLCPFWTKICLVYLHLSLPSKLGTRYCSGWWPSLKG